MAKAWEPLQTGDKIAVIFPSHRPFYRSNAPDTIGTPATEIEYHKEWINSLGLEPDIPDDLAAIEEWGEQQGAARTRAQHIIDALADPNVKAIYATGGHGADEVILELEKYYSNPTNLPKRPDAPPLIGFSDVTQLQLYLGEKGLVSPLQVASEKTPELRSLLFEQKLPQNIPLIPLNEAAERSSAISGTTIGGNDFAIYRTHRTKHRLQTKENRNNILLLEGEQSDQDFVLTLEKLISQGEDKNIKAIVLGQCYDNNGDERIHECDIGKILKIIKRINGLDSKIPIFFGAPIGHPKKFDKPLNFLPIPLNTETAIKTSNGNSTISFSPIRTIEDVKAAKEAYASRQVWQPIKTKDSNSFATASTVFQPIVLHPIHMPTEIPKHFIGCSVFGRDVPAMEGVDLNGKDLLIHMPIHGISLPDKPGNLGNLDYWTIAQTAAMPMMELIKMGNAENIKSITFSAPIPFPDRFTESLREFTSEHFPGKPIFTTKISQSTEMAQEIGASRDQPLLINFKNVKLDTALSSTTTCQNPSI